MNVAVRVDGSPSIGMGHVMRTVALARRLRARCAAVTFIMRERGGDALDAVRAHGFPVHALAATPDDGGSSPWLGVAPERDAAETAAVLRALPPCDWLVADNYGIDERWERPLRLAARGLFAFDDLADRRHAVDVLLDQNVIDARDERYRDLVPPATRVFLGPRYAQLRDEFLLAGTAPRERDGRIRSVLVAFGSDGGAHTMRALEALAHGGGLAVTVVSAATDPALQALVDRNGWTLHARVGDMAARLDAADLAIGAGGTSAWERAYLGVPAIAWAIVDNQREAIDGLVRSGAIVTPEHPEAAALAAAIAALRADPARVRALGTSARAIMRDHDRATAELDAFLLAPRPAAA